MVKSKFLIDYKAFYQTSVVCFYKSVEFVKFIFNFRLSTLKFNCLSYKYFGLKRAKTKEKLSTESIYLSKFTVYNQFQSFN